MRSIAVAVSSAIIAVVIVVIAGFGVRPAHGGPPFAAAQLQLSSVSVPFKTLSAVPPGGVPANLFYTVTANGPFCIQGLAISPGTSVATGPGGTGTVFFHLSRIDGAGMSAASLTLVEGATSGFRPQDIVMGYGSQICAAESLEFQATQFSAAHGAGVPITLNGTAIVLAAQSVTVTIN